MKKYRLPFLITLMTLALLGLTGIQIYWVANAVELRAQEFRSEARLALENVAENYDYLCRRQVIDTVLSQPTFNFTTAEMSNPPKGEKPLSVTSRQVYDEQGNLLEETEIGPAPAFSGVSIEVMADPEEVVEVEFTSARDFEARVEHWAAGVDHRFEHVGEVWEWRFSQDDSDEVSQITQPEEIPESPGFNQELKGMITELEAISRETEEFSQFMLHLRMQVSPVDTVLLDSLLHAEMRFRQFPEEMEYQLVRSSPENPFPDPNSVFPNASTDIFAIPLRAHGILGPPPILYLHFPGQQSHMLKNMAGALSMSALLLLVVVACFGYAIYLFTTHKKLSDLKSDFINNMSHELKTPISTISLASEALRDPDLINSGNQVRHFAGIIFDENKRLKQQVEKVLQMGRMEKGELHLDCVRLDLHDLLDEESIRIQAQLEQREGSLSMNLDAQNAQISADPVHMTGIIHNLLDNAMKYSPGSPKIEVSTRNLDKFVELKIRDNGMGMSREVQKRVFDKFYRASTGNRHDIKGFGLGLSYVQLMTQAHQGTITLDSTPGKGSTFTLRFPTT